MKRIQIPVPPLPEQQRIADYLDRKCASINDVIEKTKISIEEYKQFKQSAISQAVTEGIYGKRQMKESGISWLGSIPSEWSVNVLKKIGYLYGGLTGKAGDDFNVDESDIFYWFIPFTNIFNNNEILLDKLAKVKVKEGEAQNMVHKGDILFLMSSEDYESVGKPALMNNEVENLCLNSFCKGLHITSADIEPRFLNYYLQTTTVREHVRSQGNGFIRINLKANKLMCTPVLLPPLPEQCMIADFLDSKCNEINLLVEAKNRFIKELESYKKSLIYEYVTGKKEVQ